MDDTEWAALPCGGAVAYTHITAENRAQIRTGLEAVVAGHANRCPVCFATVSHPDFDLEWTA